MDTFHCRPGRIKKDLSNTATPVKRFATIHLTKRSFQKCGFYSRRSIVGRVAAPPIKVRCRFSETIYKIEVFEINRGGFQFGCSFLLIRQPLRLPMKIGAKGIPLLLVDFQLLFQLIVESDRGDVFGVEIVIDELLVRSLSVGLDHDI